jgi:hypothetical protein
VLPASDLLWSAAGGLWPSFRHPVRLIAYAAGVRPCQSHHPHLPGRTHNRLPSPFVSRKACVGRRRGSLASLLGGQAGPVLCCTTHTLVTSPFLSSGAGGVASHAPMQDGRKTTHRIMFAALELHSRFFARISTHPFHLEVGTDDIVRFGTEVERFRTEVGLPRALAGPFQGVMIGPEWIRQRLTRQHHEVGVLISNGIFCLLRLGDLPSHGGWDSRFSTHSTCCRELCSTPLASTRGTG